MEIARGSTFDFTITLPQEYDVTNAQAIWVSFGQGNNEVFTKQKSDVRVENNKIFVSLSQKDTLAFIPGEAKMQARILTHDNQSLVQEPMTDLEILGVIKDGEING